MNNLFNNTNQKVTDTEFNHRWLSINGEQTHFIDQGEGPALVLIHGLGADVSRWQYNIHALAQQHRVIAIDLLGFGQSAKPHIPFRGQTFVDHIIALLQQLEIESASLMGNSMGGWISLLIAEQYPQLVEKLILVAPAFVFGLPSGIDAEQLSRNASPQTLAEMESYLSKVYYHSPAIGNTKAIEQALQAKIANNDQDTISTVAHSLAHQEDIFSAERLSQLNKEIVIIHGDSDGIMPLAASQHLQTLLPKATLKVIEKAGHWPQLEQPNAFIDAFTEMLEE